MAESIKSKTLDALGEAVNQLRSNLCDLTDHFEIKHTRATVDTLEESIAEINQEVKIGND